MTAIIRPGAGLLFMKVGTHAKESIDDIIDRKTREIDQAGYAMWGYGGNTCHPRTMVQPFAKNIQERGSPIFLCMQEMTSNHWAEPVRAKRFSVDGIDWQEIPPAVNVLGSRFALVIKGLRREDHVLPLDQTRVAVGNSQGRVGSRYIRGRVDKACLEVTDEPERSNDAPVNIPIHLVAELADPYAVFLEE